MATYVDGYVLTVPTKQVAAYKRMASEGCKIWMKYGALDYKECMIDDATPKDVKLPFSKLVGLKPDETIFFSYIVFASKAERNRINKKVMAYFSEKYKDQKMPVTMRRFAYGGFKSAVEA
jgi:uncharacterized protein YbaA (DUF1428 family)